MREDIASVFHMVHASRGKSMPAYIFASLALLSHRHTSPVLKRLCHPRQRSVTALSSVFPICEDQRGRLLALSQCSLASSDAQMPFGRTPVLLQVIFCSVP